MGASGTHAEAGYREIIGVAEGVAIILYAN